MTAFLFLSALFVIIICLVVFARDTKMIFTGFKEGDLITSGRLGYEDWEKASERVFKISKVGLDHYQLIYIFPQNMSGFVTTRDKSQVNQVYKKYKGSLENVNWDLVK
jgi:hypothetical protein